MFTYISFKQIANMGANLEPLGSTELCEEFLQALFKCFTLVALVLARY